MGMTREDERVAAAARVETYSWEIELKSGSRTRIDGVRDEPNLVVEDLVELFDGEGVRVFAAPLSAISYMQRLEPRGKNVDPADSITFTNQAGLDAAAALRVLSGHLRSKGQDRL